MEDGPSGLTGPHVQWRVVEGLRLRQGRVLILLLLMEVKSVRERTSDLGENVRRRYGSQFNVACGKYEHLPDDTEDIDSSYWAR